METLSTCRTTAEQCVFSLHSGIRNKPVHWLNSFGENWTLGPQPSLTDLRLHVAAGGAFIPAAMTSSHRSTAAFGYADLVVVDIDHGLTIEQFRSHPLAASAAWVYTTCSHRAGEHERFRVVFRLPWRIDDPDLYKATVTLLSRALGGDRSCTDPCRLFYGNDQAEHPIWNPDAVLPESIIDDARTEAGRTRIQYDRATAHYDDNTIRQAIFVLEQVLEPTADGERDRFIRITAAAASGGEPLFQAWSDWASRGHHGSGKNSRQANEKFFRGFHGRSTLATLFFLASEQDPDWRKNLPEELRSSFSFTHTTANVAGYDHEDFLGLIDEENERPRQITTAELATPSLFDTERPWMTVLQPPEQQADQPAATSARRANDGPPAYHDEDIDDSDEEIDPELLEDPYADILGEFCEPEDQPVPPAANRRRRQANYGIDATKDRLLMLYPGLRLNRLTQKYEYGPKQAPVEIPDITEAYVRISRGVDQIFQKTATKDTADVIARENSYHPVIEYLEKCANEVEPCPFFGRLATAILGLPDDELKNPTMEDGRRLGDVVLERFLIAAVARTFEPGCTVQWMPILVGNQAVGKSRFFAKLTPPVPAGSQNHSWTSFNQFPLRSLAEKPHLLHSGWIVVLDETERHFKRDEVETFKNIVSISTDRSARKYENERDYPRAFVLAGATNTDSFLKDPTGNRRFLPVYVVGNQPHPANPFLLSVDFQSLDQHRDAIWSAAVHAYRQAKQQGREPWHFESHELASLKDYVDGFFADNPIFSQMQQATKAAIERMLNRALRSSKQRYFMTLDEIYSYLGIPVDRQTSINLQLTDALKRLGWTSQRITHHGERLRVWFLPPSQQDPQDCVAGAQMPSGW